MRREHPLAESGRVAHARHCMNGKLYKKIGRIVCSRCARSVYAGCQKTCEKCLLVPLLGQKMFTVYFVPVWMPKICRFDGVVPVSVTVAK